MMHLSSKSMQVGKAVSSALLIGLFSLYGITAIAQTATATAKPAPTVAAEAPTKGMLFEIKSANNTAYLFGSIHIAKADFYPMSPKVEAAYAQADLLAIEADATDQSAMMQHMPKLMYAAPDKLQNHLKPTTWDLMVSMAGPQAEQMQSLKPAMVAMSVFMGAASTRGYLPTLGIDAHYINRAKQDKKTLVELESIEFQLNLLAGLTDEEGDAMVEQTFKSFKDKTFFNDLEKLVNTWKSADVDALAKILNEANNKDAGSKKLAKLMFDDRNEGMAVKITKLMNEGKKPFIVVGAGHLAGEKSIVDLLQKQGLQVTQIK